MVRTRFIAAATLAVLIVLLTAGAALAHETRVVGKYQVIVGFATEPAYVNTPNAIDLRVTNNDTKAPVAGLEKTLQAEVIFGGRSMPVQLTPRFGQPGAYLGNFIPTRTGSYIFHLRGQIENQPVDEQFESGPNTFSDVEDPSTLDFPDKVPSPPDMAKQLQAMQNALATVQTLSIAGIIVGVVGMILGGVALLRRK